MASATFAGSQEGAALSDKGPYSPVEIAPVSAPATVEPDWAALIAASPKAVVFEATTYHRGPWTSISRPVCVQCSDKQFRVIKRPLPPSVPGCLLFTDQVVARLAQLIGAPVPPPAIVQLSPALIGLEKNLSHMTAGLCHGSLFSDGHSDRAPVLHIGTPENRTRFARLAVLYGWAHAGDHQQIYPTASPHLVLSVDHGHFIGGGSTWTEDTLATVPPAAPDSQLVATAALTHSELFDAIRTLDSVVAQNIAEAVATPPDEWGVLAPEREALAAYFWARRKVLLDAYPIPTTVTATPGTAGE